MPLRPRKAIPLAKSSFKLRFFRERSHQGLPCSVHYAGLPVRVPLFRLYRFIYRLLGRFVKRFFYVWFSCSFLRGIFLGGGEWGRKRHSLSPTKPHQRGWKGPTQRRTNFAVRNPRNWSLNREGTLCLLAYFFLLALVRLSLFYSFRKPHLLCSLALSCFVGLISRLHGLFCVRAFIWVRPLTPSLFSNSGFFQSRERVHLVLAYFCLPQIQQAIFSFSSRYFVAVNIPYCFVP